MPKRTRAQRIGLGSPVYVASIQRRFALGYPSHLFTGADVVRGRVVELHHDAGRGYPVAEIELNGQTFFVPAVMGLHVGQVIEAGLRAKPTTGNIVPIGTVPEGQSVSCVELRPGDGGKLVRGSGSYAEVVSHAGDRSIVRLPSKKMKELDSRCFAIVGVVAGSGRPDKPFLKAGKKFHWMRARHRLGTWPRVRGVAMQPVKHPFGGGSGGKLSRPEPVKRTAPPGQKIGLIAAKRTGRRKKT
ncbi:MAG: 50S ribosomal protein L2 [Thaumarchaeota archaeon]|nr:50S ribosomal protein L2 [Candidatus Calditenuaceae archaeon]MDW8042041.1 50S ribosomal protein L2 [Nitrososphaerota archaeon]